MPTSPLPAASRAAALAGLALVGTGVLAGCSATAPEPGIAESTSGAGTTPTRTSTSTPTASATSAAEASNDSGYADGTYTADGSYVAPSGPESVTVTITLADGVVSSVEVTGHARDPQAQSFQAQFASGIAGVVVGRPIDGLAVDRVAGSSLTSGGFNAALETIRGQASA